MRHGTRTTWYIAPLTGAVIVIAAGAYIAHEPAAKSAPPTPILPLEGLRVELIKTQAEFVETLVSGDNLCGCDVNGDLLCDGADIQPLVDAYLD